MTLDPQWLRTFAALVDAGNFTRAAARLDLTQAAVSQHVRHLEDAARASFANQKAIDVVECGAPVVDTLWLIYRAEWPLPARCARAVTYSNERVTRKTP